VTGGSAAQCQHNKQPEERLKPHLQPELVVAVGEQRLALRGGRLHLRVELVVARLERRDRLPALVLGVARRDFVEQRVAAAAERLVALVHAVDLERVAARRLVDGIGRLAEPVALRL
jgi:hypothetical protein